LISSYELLVYSDISTHIFPLLQNSYLHSLLHLLACKIQYGGGPTLSHDDCCWDCIIEGAQNVVSADSYRDQRESLKQFARAILDGNYEDGKYYVSRPW